MSALGQKTVRFSDLSGELIMEDDGFVRIVVHEHPELGDAPVEIEALAAEAAVIADAALDVAIVDLYYPGDDTPQRFAIDATAFDKLATAKPASELLIAARPARRGPRPSSGGAARGGRPNYATLEHAGTPHKGKITEAEQQLVREHLDEINERLAAQGHRTIDPADPEHVERYALTALAQERDNEEG